MPIIPPRCSHEGCRKPRVQGTGRCLEHQPKAFAHNYRAARLPPKSVWNGLRQEVFERWNWRCYLCGEEGADTIDHIVPGDNHDISNLAPVHDKNFPHCHRYKTAQEGVNSRAKRTEWGTYWLKKMNEDDDIIE